MTTKGASWGSRWCDASSTDRPGPLCSRETPVHLQGYIRGRATDFRMPAPRERGTPLQMYLLVGSEFHLQTLLFNDLGFNRNYCTFASEYLGMNHHFSCRKNLLIMCILITHMRFFFSKIIFMKINLFESNILHHSPPPP